MSETLALADDSDGIGHTNYTVDSPQGFQLLDLHHILYMDVYTSCESGIAYPIMFQWLMLRINVPVRRRHTGSCFRIADLFSSAAVGLEPKRPVRIAPLVLDHRVFSCDIILDP